MGQTFEDIAGKVSDSELQHTVQEAAEKVKKLSEELRQRIHSVQMGAEGKALDLLQTIESLSEKMHFKTDAEEKAFELLTSLEGLSERLQGYAEGFEDKVAEGQLQIHLGLMQALERWEQLKVQVHGLLGTVNLDTAPRAFFDEVKLRANLGGMEAGDMLNKSREEVAKAWQTVSQQSMAAVKSMNQSLGDIIHRFV